MSAMITTAEDAQPGASRRGLLFGHVSPPFRILFTR